MCVAFSDRVDVFVDLLLELRCHSITLSRSYYFYAKVSLRTHVRQKLSYSVRITSSSP